MEKTKMKLSDERKAIHIIIAVIMLSILLLEGVNAMMPRYTHKLMHELGTQNQSNTEIYRICNKYQTECYVGNVLTDVSVVWYWTKFDNYDVTHSPNFARALLENAKNEQEIACAGGNMVHQAEDIVSHNNMVPYSITHSGLSNMVIHVFAEQKVDNWVEKNYPEVGDIALNQLADFEKCVPLFKRTMLGEEQYSDVSPEELDDLFEKFIYEIQTSQTGYDVAFKSKSIAVNFKTIPFSLVIGFSLIMIFFLVITILLLIKVFKKQAKIRHFVGLAIFFIIFGLMAYIFIANANGSVFRAIISIAKPISGLVPLGNSEQFYVNEGISNTKELLANGEIWLENSQASGLVALENADRRILLFDWIILFGIISLLGWYTWYILKSNKIKIKNTLNL
jgi:hypothetical protein